MATNPQPMNQFRFVSFYTLTCFQATYPGGSIVMVGRGSFDVTIPYTIAATKEVDIKGIFRYANW